MLTAAKRKYDPGNVLNPGAGIFPAISRRTTGTASLNQARRLLEESSLTMRPALLSADQAVATLSPEGRRGHRISNVSVGPFAFLGG